MSATATGDERFDPVGGVLSVLSLAQGEARTTEDIFTGVSARMPHGRIFGGQVLGQAVIAASRTVDSTRPIHSMHGYFLRPGDSTRGVTLSVDRLRDGRSFSARRTQAFQDGAPIFSMIASFEAEAGGVDHATPPPSDIPPPEELADIHDDPRAVTLRSFGVLPIDARHVEGSLFGHEAGAVQRHQAVWVRTRGRLSDDPLLHRAALAFLSDLTIQEPILRAHGLTWTTAGMSVASLDHAMWWHRFARVDEWLLYVQESPSAQGGRGLSTGRIYSREGELVASVAQEVMVRLPHEQG